LRGNRRVDGRQQSNAAARRRACHPNPAQPPRRQPRYSRLIAQHKERNAMTAPTIASVLAANAAASPAPAPSTSVTGLGSDFKTFLTLLTTQLQNHDPLSPLDTNQFTQQLVSFSQVEQAINANDKLANLVSLQSTDQSISALPLVGHTIEYADNQGALVNGEATFGYNLPSNAAAANIVITDANGQTVFQTPAETDSGFHSFTWDGTTLDGSKAPDGV